MKSKSYDWRYGDEAVDSDEQSGGDHANASRAAVDAAASLNILGLESVDNSYFTITFTFSPTFTSHQRSYPMGRKLRKPTDRDWGSSSAQSLMSSLCISSDDGRRRRGRCPFREWDASLLRPLAQTSPNSRTRRGATRRHTHHHSEGEVPSPLVD